MNAQLCLDLGHALPVRRTHPLPRISPDGLAVTPHCSAPSSPLVEKVTAMERRQLSWQRGAERLFGRTAGAAAPTPSSQDKVVIPKRVREAFGLSPGQPLQVIALLGQIELVPSQSPVALRGFL